MSCSHNLIRRPEEATNTDSWSSEGSSLVTGTHVIARALVRTSTLEHPVALVVMGNPALETAGTVPDDGSADPGTSCGARPLRTSISCRAGPRRPCGGGGCSPRLRIPCLFTKGAAWLEASKPSRRSGGRRGGPRPTSSRAPRWRRSRRPRRAGRASRCQGRRARRRQGCGRHRRPAREAWSTGGRACLARDGERSLSRTTLTTRSLSFLRRRREAAQCNEKRTKTRSFSCHGRR